jgi:hypothetical protein
MATDRHADAGLAKSHVHPQQRGSTPPTVVCPNGHINAWNYRFCAQCGAPISAQSTTVPWPDEPSPHSESWRPPVKWLSICAAALLVVATAVTVTNVLTRPDSSPSERDSTGRPVAQNPSTSTKPCASAPILHAESADLTADGMSISAALSSPCASGDVESNSALHVTVVDGQRDVAAGSFDFSADPVVIPSGGTARRIFVFPAGMYWRIPELLSAAPSMSARRVGQPTSGRAFSTTTRASVTADEPVSPQYASADAAAESELHEISNADRPTVRRDVDNHWVPQVSSKRPGLVAEGRTWTYADILRDHLLLRQRFGEARLLWSGNWTTFSEPYWWVTVVAMPHTTPQEANSWCDGNGFASEQCFAKLISTILGVRGTTVYRH